MLDLLLQGLWAFGPAMWAALLGGTVLGYLIGALPGIGPVMTIALITPFTFGLDPALALVGLIAIYVAAEYGGAISAILMNMPGEAAAVATSWDGYPMARRGEAGKALHISIVSSGMAALLSTLLLIALAVPLAEFAVQFGPSEYFALGLLGLTLAASLSGRSLTRGVIAVGLGLLLTFVGIDSVSGEPRFAPVPALYDGIPLVAALTGLYAMSEVFMMAEESRQPPVRARLLSGLLGLPLRMYRPLLGVIMRSSLIGFVIGVIPGAGAVIASLVAYSEARRRSEDPDSFGQGNPAGVAAAEAANNAAVPGNLAPLLALGIPGSSTAAVLASALTIHGIQPGPLLFAKHPEVPYSIFVSLLLGVPVMVLVGLIGVRGWARLTQVPRPLLAALIAVTCCIGAYSTANDLYPVYVMLGFGVLGWLLRKLQVPLGPLVLGFVIGEMLETNFRRMLLVAQGDLTMYLHHPITLVLLLLTVLMVGLSRRRLRQLKLDDVA
jgi:putative tricarboxylic transport membrane protein